MKQWVTYSAAVVLCLVCLYACNKGSGVNTTGTSSIYVQAEDEGKTGEVCAAVRNGFDVNKPDENGQTLLHHAVLGNNRSLVESLIEELRAKKNIKDKDGNTAFDLTEPNSEIAKLFSNDG